jgi:hypothetical protein
LVVNSQNFPDPPLISVEDLQANGLGS